MGSRVARIQSNRFLVLLFRRLPVPMIIFTNEGERSVRLCQAGIELQRSRRGTTVAAPQRVTVGQAGIGARILRVFVNRLLKVVDRRLNFSLIPEVQAL